MVRGQGFGSSPGEISIYRGRGGAPADEGRAGRGDNVVKAACRQTPAAEIVEGRVGIERLGSRLSPAEVGDKDPAVVSGDREFSHVRPLRYQNAAELARNGCAGCCCIASPLTNARSIPAVRTRPAR